MDQFRHHVRSTVVVNDDLLEQVPPRDLTAGPLEDPAVLIVGNTVAVAGGSLANHQVVIAADTVTAVGGADSISLTTTPTAAKETDGRAGTTLRVIAGRLSAGRGTSKGQRGGKGKKGRDGIQMPPIQQPPFDPTGPKPPEVLSRAGENGGKGRRGGDGGAVQLFLRTPSAVTGAWSGLGGDKGEGGAGGVGEPPANHNSEPGENGLDGPEGDPGLDKPAAVQVGEATWRGALNQSGTIARWSQLRTNLAIEEFRRDNPTVALAELAAATDVFGGGPPVPNPLAPHLPVLIRDNRAATGVARDQELVPDITEHAQRHTGRAQVLAAALPAGGTLGGDAVSRLTVLKEQLTAMLNPGGELTVQENDLKGRADAALVLVNALAKRAGRTRGRLDAVLAPDDGPAADPTVTVGGLALTAAAIATGLVTVLGTQAPGVVAAPPDGTVIWPATPFETFGFQPAGDQATLLPVDLDLLVHRSIRNRAETVTPTELAGFRASAAGLGRLAEWGRVGTGQPGNDGKPVVVNLATVAGELRTAGGDRAVLDLLVELAEVTHVWRLARARTEQVLAGRKTLEIQRGNAESARAQQPNPPGPADLLPSIRVLLDTLQWYADRAKRASALLTFGLADPAPAALNRYPFPPGFSGDVAGLLPVLYSPDWAADLDELSPTSLGTATFDAIINAVRGRDPKKPYDDYLLRGIPLVGLSPAPLPKRFTVTARPDVIERFAETGEFWFDTTFADLAGPTGASPHAEARVVGVKVSLEFAVAGPGVDVPLRVTHTGLSAQRDMAGTIHRQTMLPASVEVNVAPVADALHVGETSLNPPGQPPIRPIDFPVYGRGAVASWLVQRQETITVLPDLAAIIVEVLYEGIVPPGTASLRSVAFAGAGLRVGGEAVITVALTGPAGLGGVKVQLASSDPATVSVPTSVLVPQGKLSTPAFATILEPTGARPPTLTARTADGVTRLARPVVPAPARPTVASVALVPPGQSGTIAAVAVVPGAVKQPGRVVATVSPPVGPVEDPEPKATVHERRPDTLAPVRQATVGHQPRSLAVDPTRKRIYVANNGDSSVSMLDADTLTTLAEQKVGLHVDVEVDPAAGLVYVSLFGAAKLLILSADDLSVQGEVVDVPRLRRPHGLAVFPGTGRDAMIYVARTVRGIEGESEESAVTQIRRTASGTHAIVRSLDLGPILTQPVDVAVDTVHKLVFVSCLGGNDIAPALVVLEHPTMKELHRVPLFSGGRAVESRAGSGLAYVAGEAGLTIVDGRAGLVTTRFRLGDEHLDQGLPLALAVDQVTGTAYVGARDHATLFRIDAPADAGRVFW